MSLNFCEVNSFAKLPKMTKLTALAFVFWSCFLAKADDKKGLDSFKAMVNHHIDSYNKNHREHVTMLVERSRSSLT